MEDDVIVMRSAPPPNAFNNESSRRVIPRGNYTLAFSLTYKVHGAKTTILNAKKVGTESGRSFWTSGTTELGTWVQNGYREDGKPVIEYYGGPGISQITILNQSPIVMNSKQTFYIKQDTLPGWGIVGRNDLDVLKFYEGSTYMYNVQTGIEYYSIGQAFPELNCDPAIEVLVNDEWVIPPASYITYCGKWGVSGDEQDIGLKHGQLLFGGKNKPLPLNTWLFKNF